MRIAVISDIHGNLEALDQVLQDVDKSHIDTVVSLGDTIGYGPDPEEVVKKLRHCNIPSIMGNHELAVVDKINLEWFNHTARESLIKTTAMLSKSSLEYISTLKPYLVRHQCRFVHGFPPDSPTIYSFQVSENTLLETFQTLDQKVCFIGHTHYLYISVFDGRTITITPLKQGVMNLSDNQKYIVNIGSVGQPRDGNNNAKYIIWDSVAKTIQVKYVPYNIAKVVAKIYAMGLPHVHADRLW